VSITGVGACGLPKKIGLAIGAKSPGTNPPNLSALSTVIGNLVGLYPRVTWPSSSISTVI